MTDVGREEFDELRARVEDLHLAIENLIAPPDEADVAAPALSGADGHRPPQTALRVLPPPLPPDTVAPPPEALRAAWGELMAWVDWLVATYDLPTGGRWASCWYRHPGVVHELLALRRWHLEVLDSEASGADLFLWHDALWRFRDRALVALKGCVGSDGHREQPPSSAAGLLRDEEARRAHVDAAVTTATEPPPSSGSTPAG
jgi:hypothetical protein